MKGRIEDIGRVMAAVSRAAGSALDPATILARTMDALAPVITVRAARLWLDGPGDPIQWAPHPDDGGGPPGGGALATTIGLLGADGPFGQLVVEPSGPAEFDDAEVALLEITAGQITGALERARLFQEVMELERLKSDFIARVSHELRTPITIINGFLDTMLAHEDTLGREQRHHMLQRSQVAATRLSALIEELLILSRLDAGVLTPDLGATDLGTILLTVRDSSAEPDQVLVTAPIGARLTTDPALLGRALGLVVDNAIKYGGTAEVQATLPTGEQEWWTVEVRDRGAGFADDVRDTAFEMFTRSQGTTAVPGLGVGLSIARTLIEVLDGTIAIDHDHPGTGALVRITLPER